MMRVFLVDLGGSALKAGVYDLDGTEIALANIPLSFIEDNSGKAEQDPEIWWEALQAAAQIITDKSPDSLANIVAVAICGFTRSQVFLDENSGIIRPAITFRDARGHELAQAMLDDQDLKSHPHSEHFNGFHPYARLLWLKKFEPESFIRLKTIIEPKDFLNFKLTNRICSDPISQFWSLEALKNGDQSFAHKTGLLQSFLPSLLSPTDIIGSVSPSLPGALSQLSGARVFCCSNDTWTGVAGLGALKAGFAYGTSGSSEVFGVMAADKAKADGLITLQWGENIWHLGGPSQNGGNALFWIINQLDQSDKSFDQKLASCLEQQSGKALLFHPYLYGERTPYWDPNLMASFIGLTCEHKKGDMVRAVMEGVVYVNRLVLERAESATGSPVSAIYFAGGGTKSPFWNQIRANILKRPVIASPHKEMGLMGGLTLARVGLGIDKNLSDAAKALSKKANHYMPEPEMAKIYDEVFALFKETHSTIAHSSHRLSEINQL